MRVTADGCAGPNESEMRRVEARPRFVRFGGRFEDRRFADDFTLPVWHKTYGLTTRAVLLISYLMAFF